MAENSVIVERCLYINKQLIFFGAKKFKKTEFDDFPQEFIKKKKLDKKIPEKLRLDGIRQTFDIFTGWIEIEGKLGKTLKINKLRFRQNYIKDQEQTKNRKQQPILDLVFSVLRNFDEF